MTDLGMYPIRRLFTSAAMALLLGACAQAPVPQDHFYRLPDPATTVRARLLDGSLAVQRLRTDGVYSQRPMLYSPDTDSVELRQYHYHYWTDSPPRLLQDHLVAFLRGSGIANTTLAATAGTRSDYLLGGRLARFEQVRAGNTVLARVELELTLQKQDGAMLLVKDYRAERPAQDDSLPATVKAFDLALQDIYTAFLADLGAPGR